MKLVKFTDMRGMDAWVSPTHVVGVTCKWCPNEEDYLTVIWCIDGRLLTVTESIKEVVNRIDIWLG